MQTGFRAPPEAPSSGNCHCVTGLAPGKTVSKTISGSSATWRLLGAVIPVRANEADRNNVKGSQMRCPLRALKNAGVPGALGGWVHLRSRAWLEQARS